MIQPVTTPAKKVAAKKVPVKKVPAKKATAKKAPARKTVAATKPAVKPAKPKKPAKVKVIRDSFTMPEADFAIIDRIKLRAIEWKQPVKKSEVLRAALHALGALSDAQIKKLLSGLTPVKKGRPNSQG